jgi:hypothetical protein
VLRRITIIVLVLVGVGMLAAAHRFEAPYEQGLLLNLGTGFLLFALLYLIQQTILDKVRSVERETRQSVSRLTESVGKIEEDVRETQARLGELAGEARASLRRRREQSDLVFERFAENVDADTTAALLREAKTVGSISDGGIRMRVPWTHLWIRFRPVFIDSEAGTDSGLAPQEEGAARSDTPDAVWIGLERIDGSSEGERIWTRRESTVDLNTWLALRLQQLGQYPGDDGFDPDAIFGALRDALRVVVDARREGGPNHDLDPLIEMPNDEWVITVDGMDCLVQPYPIHRSRLDENWMPHIGSKTWANIDKFEQTFNIARELFVGGARRKSAP